MDHGGGLFPTQQHPTIAGEDISPIGEVGYENALEIGCKYMVGYLGRPNDVAWNAG
ncbi:hypothetical protein [Yersinia ruckeri]|uniref:hypothetical protein n=1 Tax=Yersinia ruckeri TaxID=29486 RepID=UPI0013922AB9|nr:hypothetical protein [Yersinia ruckeri]EKN4198485.1 hypothetical protein [Yersinia ruckeri]EKN4687693.1 hypothetical protein [Yersinia ruckeri]EKN4702301.1 hypothetical protein [Yersinia ruckeri]MCK8539854.1 hypothetical protein [Yersinia ruckeri]MCK8543812.1 hypothetical protein [Yersinia ruckeri]